MSPRPPLQHATTGQFVPACCCALSVKLPSFPMNEKTREEVVRDDCGKTHIEVRRRKHESHRPYVQAFHATTKLHASAYVPAGRVTRAGGAADHLRGRHRRAVVLVGDPAGLVGHGDAVVAPFHQEAFRPDLLRPKSFGRGIGFVVGLLVETSPWPNFLVDIVMFRGRWG